MPPRRPVSFVAIGLFVATIGFSIGLEPVAGAEVSGGGSRLVQANSQPVNGGPGSALREMALQTGNGSHCP